MIFVERSDFGFERDDAVAGCGEGGLGDGRTFALVDELVVEGVRETVCVIGALF